MFKVNKKNIRTTLWHSSTAFIRGGSRTAATCKMERFMITVNSYEPLTIITKSSILDVAAVLDPSLFIVNFEHISHLFRLWIGKHLLGPCRNSLAYRRLGKNKKNCVKSVCNVKWHSTKIQTYRCTDKHSDNSKSKIQSLSIWKNKKCIIKKQENKYNK